MEEEEKSLIILDSQLRINCENEIANVAKGSAIQINFNAFAFKLKEAIRKVF